MTGSESNQPIPVSVARPKFERLALVIHTTKAIEQGNFWLSRDIKQT